MKPKYRIVRTDIRHTSEATSYFTVEKRNWWGGWKKIGDTDQAGDFQPRKWNYSWEARDFVERLKEKGKAVEEKIIEYL